jgi:hypothetical protein
VQEKIWLKIGSWDGPHGIGGVVSLSFFFVREDKGNIGGHQKKIDRY